MNSPARRFSFLAVLLVMLVSLGASVHAQASMLVPAVDSNHHGVITVIRASVFPATGNLSGVFVDVYPLFSQDTQESARTAAKAASSFTGIDITHSAVLYKIETSVDSVDGPSGGQAFTLLTVSELTGKAFRSDYVLSATGTIETDGRIGPVGGVKDKIIAANLTGVTLLLLPQDQVENDGFDYPAFAQSLNPRLHVVQVATINQSAQVAFAPAGTALPVFASPSDEPLVLPDIKAYLSSNVQPFKTIAVSTLARANAKLQSVKSKVASSSVGTPSDSDSRFRLPDALVTRITKTLDESQREIDNGYYYSAANNAFVALIRLDGADLALSNTTAGQLSDQFATLSERVDALPYATVTGTNLDWEAGAQVRATWAAVRINETQTDLDAAIQDAQSSKQPLTPDDLADDYSAYANALEWVNAAEQLNTIAAQMPASSLCTGACAAFDESSTRNYSRQALDAAFHALNATDGTDDELNFHYTSAVRAFEDGHFVASSFDSGFVLAYSKADGQSQGKTASDMSTWFVNATALREPFLASPWGQLYESHALYSLQTVNRSGIQALRNAFKLQSLAFALSDNTKQLIDQGVRPVQYTPSGPIATPFPSQTPAEPSVRPIVTPSNSASAQPTFTVVVTNPENTESRVWLFLGLLLVAFGVIIALVLVLLSRPKTLPRMSNARAPKAPAAKRALKRNARRR